MSAANVEHTRISPWAVASVLCSLIFFCPLTTALGVLFGLWALWDIHRHPQRTGNGVAFTGLALGALMTGLLIAGGMWWNYNVRRPMLHGPYAALTAGLQGNVDVFKNGFVGPGANADDDEANQFLSRLSNRYGEFITSRQDEFAASDDQARIIQTGSVRIPYELTFTGGTVQALAQYVLRDEKRGFVSRFRYLAVFDETRGPLVYPPSLADEAVSHRQELREQTVEKAIEQEQQRQPGDEQQLPGPSDSPDKSAGNESKGEQGSPR